MAWEYHTIQTEITAVRKELTEIAQAYNAAGSAILTTLYPGGYVRHGKVLGALKSIGDMRVLLVRIPVKPISDSERRRSCSERSDAGGSMVSEVIGMGQGAGSSSSRFSLFLGGWG